MGRRMKKPLSFAVIGSGWRAMFYVRIAVRFPELFHLKYLLCRRKEKAEQIGREWKIPVTLSEEECAQSEPDFVVVAVSKDAIFEVAKRWAAKGVPVFCETPAAMTVEQLGELWKLKEQGARLQVAEQYIRYPVLAAGLERMKRAKAEPYAVDLSVAHDYHAVSLMRRMLCLGIEPVTLSGQRYCFPVVETDSRYGPVTDGSIRQRERTRFTLEFASGKMAFYDFSGVQYHSFIRSRHLRVQGRNFEWSDGVFRFVDDAGKAREERLLPYLDKRYQPLVTEKLKAICGVWNPSLMLEEAQDEYAIASMLLDMERYLTRGVEVYPLAEALEDAYVWMLMRQAAENPGSKVQSERMPWHSEGRAL